MEHWQRIDELFQQACELPHERREQFLRAKCADDDALLRKVMSLIDSDSRAGKYLQTSTFDLIGERIGAADDDQTGRRIGPYRLIKRLGAGGMGAVYPAERDDEQFQQTVAIKLIKRGMDTDVRTAGARR